jgi:hypothetical protein
MNFWPITTGLALSQMAMQTSSSKRRSMRDSLNRQFNSLSQTTGNPASITWVW